MFKMYSTQKMLKRQAAFVRASAGADAASIKTGELC